MRYFSSTIEMKGGLPFSTAFLSTCVLIVTSSLFLSMPKLRILNSHKYAARRNAGVHWEEADFDLNLIHLQGKESLQLQERRFLWWLSACDVSHGLVFASALGAKLKLFNRKQRVV